MPKKHQRKIRPLLEKSCNKITLFVTKKLSKDQITRLAKEIVLENPEINGAFVEHVKILK